MLQTELAVLLSQLHLSAPAQTLEKLELYWERVKQAPINLTAIKTDADAALLHFADSLAPLAFNFIADHAKLIDVGTGGGFPAVPLAVMRDDISVTAMDATRKKIDFIRENAPVSNLTCIQARAEEAGHGPLRETFDIACARAVAPLNLVAEYLAPFVKIGGIAIAYKADLTQEELESGIRAAKMLGLSMRTPISFSLNGIQTISRTLVVFDKKQATPPRFPRTGAHKKPL